MQEDLDSFIASLNKRTSIEGRKYVKNGQLKTEPIRRLDFKERGVSKKERRRRRAAMIEAMDQVDKSPEEALQALKEAMNVDTSNEA